MKRQLVVRVLWISCGVVAGEGARGEKNWVEIVHPARTWSGGVLMAASKRWSCLAPLLMETQEPFQLSSQHWGGRAFVSGSKIQNQAQAFKRKEVTSCQVNCLQVVVWPLFASDAFIRCKCMRGVDGAIETSKATVVKCLEDWIAFGHIAQLPFFFLSKSRKATQIWELVGFARFKGETMLWFPSFLELSAKCA